MCEKKPDTIGKNVQILVQQSTLWFNHHHYLGIQICITKEHKGLKIKAHTQRLGTRIQALTQWRFMLFVTRTGSPFDEILNILILVVSQSFLSRELHGMAILKRCYISGGVCRTKQNCFYRICCAYMQAAS